MKLATTVILSIIVLFSGVTAAETAAEKESLSYCIPINGKIGTDINLKLFKKWQRDIRKKKPVVVILKIDSTGGDIEAVDDLLKCLAKIQTDYHTVAYVLNANTASAPIALACQKIYMAPNARIGGAIPICKTNLERDTNNRAYRNALQAALRQGDHSVAFAAKIIETAATPKSAITAGIATGTVDNIEDLLAAENITAKPDGGGEKIWKLRKKQAASAKKRWDKFQSLLKTTMDCDPYVEENWLRIKYRIEKVLCYDKQKYEVDYQKALSKYKILVTTTKKMLALAKSYPELGVIDNVPKLQKIKVDALDGLKVAKEKTAPQKQKAKKKLGVNRKQRQNNKTRYPRR